MYAGFLTISCVSMLAPEYWRFFSVMVLFGGCLFLYASRSADKPVRYLIHAIFLLMPLCTAVWVGTLLHGCELHVLLGQSFLSSPIIVLIKDLIHAFGG